MGKKTMIAMVGVAVIFGAGGFFGGLKYGQSAKALSKLAPSQIQAAFAAGRGGNGTFMFGGGMRRTGGTNNANGFTGGQILSKDDKSITIQLPNNMGTKIVYLPGSLQVQKSVSGATTDLNTGEDVTIQGTSNSDGTLTAQSIQIRPQMMQTQIPQ